MATNLISLRVVAILSEEDPALEREGTAIRFGPGYRLYYGREGNTLVILLSGGRRADERGNRKFWKDHCNSFARSTWDYRSLHCEGVPVGTKRRYGTCNGPTDKLAS